MKIRAGLTFESDCSFPAARHWLAGDSAATETISTTSGKSPVQFARSPGSSRASALIPAIKGSKVANHVRGHSTSMRPTMFATRIRKTSLPDLIESCYASYRKRDRLRTHTGCEFSYLVPRHPAYDMRGNYRDIQAFACQALRAYCRVLVCVPKRVDRLTGRLR